MGPGPRRALSYEEQSRILAGRLDASGAKHRRVNQRGLLSQHAGCERTTAKARGTGAAQTGAAAPKRQLTQGAAMAPTRAAPRPLVESNTRERNNDACLESGPAPERRRPGAERGLAAAAALDHGDRANYQLWYESAVRRHDAPKPLKQAPPASTEEGPPPRVTSGAPARDHGLLLRPRVPVTRSSGPTGGLPGVARGTG